MKKILKTLLVLNIVTILLLLDFTVLGKGIIKSIAAGNMEGISTNVENVHFDAYFKDESQNIYEKQAKIREPQSLIISINIINEGSFSDGKIKIEDSNFKFKTEGNNNTNIKEIKEDEITFNTINYGRNINVEIPIEFKKQENFEENYFEKETKVIIEGNYQKSSEEKVKEVEGSRNIKLKWTEDEEIEISQEIEKYTIAEENVILQQRVITSVKNNNLPREEEKINIQVPEIASTKPENVEVLLNGNKIEENKINYNKENGKVEITNTSKGKWGSQNNEYKIIYLYNKEVGEEKTQINLNTKTETKLYTKEAITKEQNETKEIEKTGNIVSIKKQITNSLYKGYMYANKGQETIFNEENKIEISNIKGIEEIKINDETEEFLNEQAQSFNLNSNTKYKTTTINKKQMQEILGQEGIIKINDQNGETIATLNKESKTNANGEIVTNYEGEVTKLELILSAPEKEGSLKINSTRAIKSDVGYEKEQLKTFNKLQTITKVETKMGSETAKGETELKETETEAKLEISQTNWSTLQTNENIQLSVTLISNSEKHDLYKNAKVEITLPLEVSMKLTKMVRVDDIEGIEIKNPRTYINNGGNEVIAFDLEGEQQTFGNQIHKGIEVSITGNIDISKKLPSRDAKVEVNYTNENRSGETFSTSKDIKIVSKEGVLVLNELSNYNNSGEKLENIDNKTETVQLDENAEAKQTSQEITIVNNYNTEITDVSIIGKNASNGEETINDTKLKATFGLKLLEALQVQGANAKIYYSEDENADENSNTWKEEIGNINEAKAFKIEIEGNKIAPKEVVQIPYKVEIPANLGNNQSTYTNLSVNYNIDNTHMQTNSNILLITAQVDDEIDDESEEDDEPVVDNNIPLDSENAKNEQVENLKIEMFARSGDKYLKNGDTVKEGQGIKYIARVTNTGNEAITNLKITATNTNAIFYGEVKEKIEDEDAITKLGYDEMTFDRETQEKQNAQFEIGTLNEGETKQIEYQISVGEIKDGNTELTGTYTINATNISNKTVQNIQNTIEEAKVKLLLEDTIEKEIKVRSTESRLYLDLNVINLTEQELNNVILEMRVPSQIEFFEESDLDYYSKVEEVQDDGVYKIKEGETEFLEGGNVIKLKIPTLPTKRVEISLAFTTIGIDVTELTYNLRTYFTASIEGEEDIYISNEDERPIYQNETYITYTQSADPESGSTIQDQQQITFTYTILNNGIIAKDVTFEDEIPLGLVVERYTITRNGEPESEQEKNINLIQEVINLEPKDEIVITIYMVVDINYAETNRISNIATIQDQETEEIKYMFNEIVNQDEYQDVDGDVDDADEDDDGDDNPVEDDPGGNQGGDNQGGDNQGGDNEGGDNQGGDNQGGDSQGGDNQGDNPDGEDADYKYSISGTAWLDSNKNGIRESDEETMRNMQVILINESTGEIVKDKNGRDITTVTSLDGKYEFENLKEGNYIVGFRYETSKYVVTTYQIESATESNNSDVISSTITINNTEEKMAITKRISLADNLENIDAGFIPAEKFDLRIDKYVSNMIVQSGNETKSYSYANTQLAKIDLDRKTVAGTTIIITYDIKVTNEGEIAGYASEIVDYMPNNLKFNSELNSAWYQDTQGNIRTKQLSNQLIEAGESKTIQLVLTQTITDNIGTITNTAEIAVDDNDLAIEDIDSIIGNNANGEDDISTAEIIISIKTGRAIIYISLIISSVAIISLGIYIIKKKILNDK